MSKKFGRHKSPAIEKTDKPCIQISTHTIDQTISTRTTASVINLINELNQRGINTCYHVSGSEYEVDNLNEISNRAFANRLVTHLLLIDADVGFRSEVFFQLYEKRTSIACIDTPDVVVDLRAIYEGARRMSAVHNQAAGEKSPMPGQTKPGFMLISKDVLRAMVRALIVDRVDQLMTDDDRRWGRQPIAQHGFFSPIYDRETLVQLVSHDAFFYRWRRLCGGEIDRLDDVELTMEGVVYLNASYKHLLAYNG